MSSNVPLRTSGGIVLNLPGEGTGGGAKEIFDFTNSGATFSTNVHKHKFSNLPIQRYARDVPVYSRGHRPGLLAFILEGNHGVRTDVPRPRFDLIKRKLKVVLLKGNDERRETLFS